tara:strand:- start:1167 stop:1601 length:435 start_codon:yes stop_codon:yes gene_type:complete
MYPKTKYQQKIIAGRKSLKLKRIIVLCFAICLFCWFSIGIHNYGLAQTEDASSEEKIDSIRLVGQKIQELVKNQPVSTFVLDELKQKVRKKHKQEMKQFNYKRNQKLSAIFERFQKIRYQPVIYSGKHYDYTSYNQYFQAAQSR